MTPAILERACRHCTDTGHRFTKPRELVLKILAEEGKPLGAYEILQRLSNTIHKPNPPTVYRAIQFWHQQGFVHCIDSLKSYVICAHEHHVGQTQFLICTECNFTKEIDCDIDVSSVEKSAQKNKFEIRSYTFEIKGLCANCSVSGARA